MSRISARLGKFAVRSGVHVRAQLTQICIVRFYPGKDLDCSGEARFFCKHP
eukprot:m.134419 g.134419  ORF g.134419 m.134419 type:complete len:51 (+) comp14693_c0_seq11:1285-1437(+)